MNSTTDSQANSAALFVKMTMKKKLPNFASNIKQICGALRDLIPFLQFKKREKHPWRSVTFSKVAGFSPPWVLFTFFKLYIWY